MITSNVHTQKKKVALSVSYGSTYAGVQPYPISHHQHSCKKAFATATVTCIKKTNRSLVVTVEASYLGELPENAKGPFQHIIYGQHPDFATHT